jgi:hypothetical protein
MIELHPIISNSLNIDICLLIILIDVDFFSKLSPIIVKKYFVADLEGKNAGYNIFNTFCIVIVSGTDLNK